MQTNLHHRKVRFIRKITETVTYTSFVTIFQTSVYRTSRETLCICKLRVFCNIYTYVYVCCVCVCVWTYLMFGKNFRVKNDRRKNDQGQKRPVRNKCPGIEINGQNKHFVNVLYTISSSVYHFSQGKIYTRFFHAVKKIHRYIRFGHILYECRYVKKIGFMFLVSKYRLTQAYKFVKLLTITCNKMHIFIYTVYFCIH